MKIVAFCGSPQKEGNTVWTVEQILKGANEVGAETIYFSAGELDMKPCRGCFACKTGNDGCVIKDDMQKVYDELQDADAFIFASPIYMGQMSGQAKTFLDRLTATDAPKFSPFYKEKKKQKLILAFTQGNPDSTMFKSYIDYTKRMFEVLEYDVESSVIVAGTRVVDAQNIKGLSESLLKTGAELLG